jgi:Glutathione S-transferase, C-terminal domain
VPYMLFATMDSDVMQLYNDGRHALRAMDIRLAASEGDFILGTQPCSLDAKLYGLLAVISASDLVAPVLKQEFNSSIALKRYVERIAKYFATPAPSYTEAVEDAQWSKAATGATTGDERPESEEDKQMRRRSWWWLGAAGTAIALYIVFGGHYFDLVPADDDDDEDEHGGLDDDDVEDGVDSED